MLLYLFLSLVGFFRRCSTLVGFVVHRVDAHVVHVLCIGRLVEMTVRAGTNASPIQGKVGIVDIIFGRPLGSRSFPPEPPLPLRSGRTRRGDDDDRPFGFLTRRRIAHHWPCRAGVHTGPRGLKPRSMGLAGCSMDDGGEERKVDVMKRDCAIAPGPHAG